MGDRANIYLQTPSNDEKPAGIYLYTHWSGYRWPEALREALVFGKSHWNDPEYLGRIIASQVFSDIHNETTGGGLSLRIGDNSYPIIVCDIEAQEVSFAEAGSEADDSLRKHHISFTEYVDQERADYPSDMK